MSEAALATRGALASLLLLAAACAPGRAESGANELTVLAAASLTEAFTEIAQGFERERGAVVHLSFGASDWLATQILEGAPADVFASASERWMDVVASRGPGTLQRSVFARNRLVVVAPANTTLIDDLADLAREGIKLVLAAEGVPAGDYARRVLANAGIGRPALANVVSNEADVKHVVQKVLLGEADAGIVYTTDVTPAVAPGLRVIPIPDEDNVTAVYPIAVLSGSPRPGLARAFLEYVLGPGQEVLRAAGFLPP